MMKNLLTLFFLLIIAGSAYSQNYKEVKVYLNDRSEIQKLLDTGMEFDGGMFNKDGALDIFISFEDFEILKTTGFRYEVVIDDWFNYYNNLPKLTEEQIAAFKKESHDRYGVDGFGYGSMGGHLTLQEVINKLDTMFLQYPNLITQKFQIGTSIENRPIYAVKISDNPNVDEDEPEVFYNALIHCREPMGMMSTMYYMFYLLENYGVKPDVTYLVNNREMFFVPVINVDGYEYNRSTNPNGGGMWRKNRRNNGGSYGVDLNRNFGYKWGYDNSGSSPYPSDDTYRGTAAFSEPETQAIKNFTIARHFKTVLNYHTYGDYIIQPWGYVNQFPPAADNTIFNEMLADMSGWNNYTTGNCYATVGYAVNGGADDWNYGDTISKPKTYSVTQEVGTSGFWATIPEIYPLAQENLNPNLYITWMAGAYPFLQDPGFNKPYFLPGDTVAVQPTYYNKGLQASNQLMIELTSLSPYATVFSNLTDIPGIPSRGTAQAYMPCGLFLSPSTPIEQEIKLVLSLREGSTYIKSDTISFIVGMPTYILADTTNNINTLWTITSTPTTPKWAVTTTTFHSAPNSYTDSPTGNYVANATVTMTLTNPINLSTYQHPRLTYWTRYDLESGYDYGQVKISTNNGTSWIPLAGHYTTVGSGTFQPPGQPLYNGTRTTWVHEDLDLTPYISSQFKIRYELKSDGSIQSDGWYLDDIGVMIYAAVPVEMVSFDARTSDGSVVLNWSTATELNNKGFEVERALTDGKGYIITNYTSLGFVNGNGTTSGRSSYSFIDDSPLTGNSYYRLKQIDLDGTFKLYGPVEVNVMPVYKYTLEQNYPNPFNPSTTIKYSLAENSFVSVEIYNIIGQRVASLVNTSQEAGNYSVSFDAGKYNLSNGVYIYKLRTDNFTSNRKMILMK